MADRKEFPTLEVATCVTGIGLCNTTYVRMNEIMSWLCGFAVYTHEMVHAPTQDIAVTNAYEQFPNLPTRQEAEADWKSAGNKAIDEYGPLLLVTKGAFKRVESPITTIKTVAPHAEAIAVKP